MIKYFAIISGVLNSILLMSVLGVVPFFLYLCIIIIIGLCWFIYNLMNRLEDVTEDIEELFVGFYDLSEHLQSIHELEMFYGEPVLQDLIEHTKKVVQDIEDYKEMYDQGVETEELEELIGSDEDAP
jgi:hypothetical protein|tara:strand:+ start:5514 stop:5894 length:381 start_codon:yes stop_codon:yes gene_type:complete